MATTKEDIRYWLTRDTDDEGEKYTHMIVVCDTYDYEDYPVYVQKWEDVNECIKILIQQNEMAKIMEVYNYSMDLESQINERRAYNL